VNEGIGATKLRTPYRLKCKSLLDAERVRRALYSETERRDPSPESHHQFGALMDRFYGSPDVRQLIFEDVQSAIQLSHRDIGLGVSQVLPVLVNAAALRGRLLAIEQPELHLHPAQQAELGDVFI